MEKGIAIVITSSKGKGQMKIKNNGCSIIDLNSAIAFVELAKKDLVELLKKSIER